MGPLRALLRSRSLGKLLLPALITWAGPALAQDTGLTFAGLDGGATMADVAAALPQGQLEGTCPPGEEEFDAPHRVTSCRLFRLPAHALADLVFAAEIRFYPRTWPPGRAAGLLQTVALRWPAVHLLRAERPTADQVLANHAALRAFLTARMGEPEVFARWPCEFPGLAPCLLWTSASLSRPGETDHVLLRSDFSEDYGGGVSVEYQFGWQY